MARNPRIVAALTTVVVIATVVFAFILAPEALATAPAFMPAMWICVAVEIATGIATAFVSSRSWSNARTIIRAAVPTVFAAWLLVAATLMVLAPGLTPRTLFGVHLVALVAVALLVGGLAMSSGHVADNEAGAVDSGRVGSGNSFRGIPEILAG